MSEIKLTTLPNGIRILTDSLPGVHSVALGIWTKVGTRDEDPAHNGAAHMVEHMLFKGTRARSVTDIAEQIESVGGNINAYTSREITSYHVHMLEQDLDLGLDVLADLYQNATMPEEEIERERHVILQEIGMGNDTPDDLVFDNYYETAYPGQPLGAPILGKPHHVQSMTRDVLAGYVRRFYTPARTVIAAAGAVDHDRFVERVAAVFTALPGDTEQPRAPARFKPGEHRLMKDLEQAHILLGFEGMNRLDPDYHSAQALSTALGGGLSSRLFQEIREKRGLVYSIYSFHSGYMDSGQFAVYAGTGPQDLPELIPVTCAEIVNIAADITEEEVSRARAQMKANILMARESMMTRADQLAKTMIYRGEILDIDVLIGKIEAVSRESVCRAAKRILDAPPVLAALGPLGALENYDAIRGRLKI